MINIKLSEKDKKFLLNLARQSITYFLENNKIMNFDENRIKSSILKRKLATFVTLTENGMLRGCIGNLKPMQPLYLSVINNSVAAAFEDPRFPKLQHEELNKIKIEISILTEPKKIDYNSQQDLIKKIRAGRDGIIIKYANRQATFLPQVWKELSNKEEFLSHLCLKAMLPPDFWKKSHLEVFKYHVLSFEE